MATQRSITKSVLTTTSRRKSPNVRISNELGILRRTYSVCLTPSRSSRTAFQLANYPLQQRVASSITHKSTPSAVQWRRYSQNPEGEQNDIAIYDYNKVAMPCSFQVPEYNLTLLADQAAYCQGFGSCTGLDFRLYTKNMVNRCSRAA